MAGIDWLLLDRDRGVGQLGLPVQIDQYLVEYRGCAERTRVVEDRHDGPGVAVAVAAEAGNRTHGIQGAGLDVRLAEQRVRLSRLRMVPSRPASGIELMNSAA